MWTEEVAGTKEERGRERNQDKRERERRILHQSNVSTVPRNQEIGNQGMGNQDKTRNILGLATSTAPHVVDSTRDGNATVVCIWESLHARCQLLDENSLWNMFIVYIYHGSLCSHPPFRHILSQDRTVFHLL